MSCGILVGNPGLGEGCQMVQVWGGLLTKQSLLNLVSIRVWFCFHTNESVKHQKRQVLVFLANHLVLHAFGHVMQKPSFLVQEKCTIFCKRQIGFVSTLGVYQQKKLELASWVGTQHFQRHTHTQKKKNWWNPIPRCLPSVAIPIQGSIPPYSTFSQLSTRQLVWHVKKVHSNSETARALPSDPTAVWKAVEEDLIGQVNISNLPKKSRLNMGVEKEQWFRTSPLPTLPGMGGWRAMTTTRYGSVHQFLCNLQVESTYYGVGARKGWQPSPSLCSLNNTMSPPNRERLGAVLYQSMTTFLPTMHSLVYRSLSLEVSSQTALPPGVNDTRKHGGALMSEFVGNSTSNIKPHVRKREPSNRLYGKSPKHQSISLIKYKCLGRIWFYDLEPAYVNANKAIIYNRNNIS